MKKLISYFLYMGIVVVSLILLNIGVIVGINIFTEEERYFLSIRNISDSIQKEGGDYNVNWDGIKEIDRLNGFIIIIGEDGKLCWEYNKPEDVPEYFSLSDVANFSRWYLKDYPVYTWIRDNELMVIGLPKNSMWKYTLKFGMSALTMMFSILPYIVFFDLIIILIIPLWLTGRRMKVRERRRSEWIAGVSHDIRTPLSIVMGNAEKGSIIEKQCLRIRDLVSNLNTENKLGSGMGRWDKKEIKIAPFIREIVCDHANVCDGVYSFNFDIDKELESAVIVADENLLKRMFDNLISNSVNHNETGCNIDIFIRKHSKNKIIFSIIDNGKGVSESILKRLNSKLRHEYLPEHGIGLRVVKRITKKYKYPIVFKSEEGKYFECDMVLKTVTK